MSDRAAVAAAAGTLVLALAVIAGVGAVADEPAARDTNPAATESPATTTSTTGAADHHVAAPAGDHAADPATDHAAGAHGETDVMYADLPADLAAQVDVVKAYVERYPTAADAGRDGWVKATLSLNGIGAHYLKGGPTGFLSDYEFDSASPNVLLFDGEGPDAKIAGASFILTDPAPEGFVTDLDVWHAHVGVCFDVAQGVVIGEIDGHAESTISFTTEDCRDRGAVAFPIADLKMIHLWVGPDYIDDGPVFAHDHPKLYDGVRAADLEPSGT